MGRWLSTCLEPTSSRPSLKSPVAGLGMLLGLLIALGGSLYESGCSGPTPYYGLTLRVSGDHNSWYKGDQAPTLSWDSQRQIYTGVIELPGDELNLRLFAPRVGLLVGSGSESSSGSSNLLGPANPSLDSGPFIPVSLTTEVGSVVKPLRLSTPLAARYQFDFDPGSGKLHIDFATDAERDQSSEAALLITALRGADVLSDGQRTQRSNALIAAVRERNIETPLQSSAGPYQSITILHLGATLAPLSLVGAFNGWTAGRDPLHFVLDGRIAMVARRTRGVRFEYRFDRDGTRYADPLNLELMWDGAALPPNPKNILGGNLGEWNSVAFTPGYLEQGPRLRRLPLPTGPLGVGEVLVYLPPGYAQHSNQRYSTIYIHDGKDTIVRGQYDRALYVLGQQGQIPQLIGVFVSAPSDPTDRLAAFTHFSDSHYPDVTPQGDAYARYLFDTIIPAVERTYRTDTTRAMLGIDMAGPFSFHIAFTDGKRRFLRIASQSGRFGWGDPSPVYTPYFYDIATNEAAFSAAKARVALDWSDSDHPQVKANETLRQIFERSNWVGQARLQKRIDEYNEPWANLRAGVGASLTFLLKDLVGTQP